MEGSYHNQYTHKSEIHKVRYLIPIDWHEEMTQEKPAPAQMTTSNQPPAYRSIDSKSTLVSEKEVLVTLSLAMTIVLIQSSPSYQCNHRGSNATPILDAQLHQPAAREAVSSVHTTMQNAVDGEHCTRCTANEAARTLTKYVFDMRDAKQRGNF